MWLFEGIESLEAQCMKLVQEYAFKAMSCCLNPCLETMYSCLDPSVVAPASSGSLYHLVNCLKNLVNNFKQSSNLTHSLKPSILKGSSTLLFKPGWTVSSTQYKTTTYTILIRHKLSEVLVYEIAHRSAMKST